MKCIYVTYQLEPYGSFYIGKVKEEDLHKKEPLDQISTPIQTLAVQKAEIIHEFT